MREIGAKPGPFPALPAPPRARSGPPGKRGPRSRGGGAATERASAQRAFRRHGVRIPEKRRHPPCRGGCGGLMSFWLPPRVRRSLGPGLRRENDEINRRQSRPPSSFSGSSTLPFVSPAKAGSQGRLVGLFHGMYLSALGVPPARCSSSLHRPAPSCCGGRGGLMSFWLPPSAPWSLGPGLRRENEEVGKREAQQP